MKTVRQPVRNSRHVPAIDCQDMTNPSIRAVPVAVRLSTTLSLLWSRLDRNDAATDSASSRRRGARRHRNEQTRRWAGQRYSRTPWTKSGGISARKTPDAVASHNPSHTLRAAHTMVNDTSGHPLHVTLKTNDIPKEDECRTP